MIIITNEIEEACSTFVGLKQNLRCSRFRELQGDDNAFVVQDQAQR